ncbi:uncharacterized protein LOC134075828 [Sardina pilchardus]|uniref:uncharacterized protein LOC134075828 n=1 Tax=Sardina pilchardus TaxID=27697 RepID=UPI002E0D9E1E
MLQTIYETESCFSSDSVSGREQSLELLSQAGVSTMPSTAVDMKTSLPGGLRSPVGDSGPGGGGGGVSIVGGGGGGGGSDRCSSGGGNNAGTGSVSGGNPANACV